MTKSKHTVKPCWTFGLHLGQFSQLWYWGGCLFWIVLKQLLGVTQAVQEFSFIVHLYLSAWKVAFSFASVLAKAVWIITKWLLWLFSPVIDCSCLYAISEVSLISPETSEHGKAIFKALAASRLPLRIWPGLSSSAVFYALFLWLVLILNWHGRNRT